MRLRLILGVAILSTLMATDAFARGGGGGGMGGGPGFAGSTPPGFSHGQKTGWKGGSVPPGWSKGKKTGWNGRGLPPGLYGR
jgi:hypothetical protein